MYKYIVKRCAQILFGISWLFTSHVNAHPHNWIDLESSFILNDRGQLIEIRQTWVFDTFYSEITYSEMINDYLNETSGYKKLAQNMSNSLFDFGYFSNLKVGNRHIKLPKPNYSYVSSKMEKNQRSMFLEMHFKFEEPISIESKPLSWSVYDPSFYIDMRYEKTSALVVLGGGVTECSKELIEAKPNDDLIFYAQSLDKSASAPNNLGREFAQTFKLSCF